jgi:hemerythrin-like domain-containing protein
MSLARHADKACISNVREETMSKQRTKARTAAKDALTLLEEDHDKVRELLSKLEEAEGKSRLATLKTIAQELKVHTKIEEDIFYPAFREAAEKEEDTELYFEALEEHHVVDLVLPEIMGTDPGADEFAAKAKVLKDLVEHHAEEEEKQMFPRAKKLMEKEQLLELGQQLAEAKEALKGGALVTG